MNPWHSFCEALAAMLRTEVAVCAGEEPEVDVVVFRQDDLYSVAAQMTAKASGLGVIVSGLGGKNPNGGARSLQMSGNISISIWADPQLCGELKADDLCWLCAKAAHDFTMALSPNDVTRRLEITEICITPDHRFLIWEAKGHVKRLKTS